MLLCIGSVLTDCICAEIGFSKKSPAGNWFKILVVLAIFLVARVLRAVDLSEPAECSLTEVYFAASQQIRGTSGIPRCFWLGILLSDWGK